MTRTESVTALLFASAAALVLFAIEFQDGGTDDDLPAGCGAPTSLIVSRTRSPFRPSGCIAPAQGFPLGPGSRPAPMSPGWARDQRQLGN